MNKRIKSVLEGLGRPFLIGTVILAVPLALFTRKIGSLIPTSSIFEQPDYLNINSLDDILAESLFAPIKLLQLIVNELSNGNILYLRLVSAAFATAAGFLLFMVLKQWHTQRIALLASAMFISSSWVLHHARFVNFEVMYLIAFSGLMLVGTWLASKSHDNKLPISMFLLGILLYIPGTWLFALSGLYIFRRQIRRVWRHVSIASKLFSASLFLAVISPLIYSFTKNNDLISSWLGIANVDALTPGYVYNNIISIPKELFLSGPDEPLLWLVGTPIFDVFTAVMLFLGLYAYKFGASPARERVLFTSLLLCILLIGIGTTDHIGLLLPVLYMIAANGLAYLLQAWFTVFPRNPFARNVGLAIVIVTVAASCTYHVQRYFVAWPNAPATKKIIKTKP